MINKFFGFKEKPEQTYDQKGRRLVVTPVKVLPLKIVWVKEKNKAGYGFLQVQIRRSLTKPGKKAILREIKLTDEVKVKVGEELKVADVLKVNDPVQVRGITKGKGFAGVVKRWRFAGGPKTHGQSDRERAPGAIGMRTTPGRVWKGKKMPGHMGVKGKTIKGLKVFKIDEVKNLLWVIGVIPGNAGELVTITKE